MNIQPTGVIPQINCCPKTKQNIAFKGFASPYTLEGIEKSFKRISAEEGMPSSDGFKSLAAKLWKNLETLKEKYSDNDMIDVHLHPEGDAIWATVAPGDVIQQKRNSIHGSGQELAHTYILSTGDKFVSEIDGHAQQIEKDYAHWVK